MNWLSQGVDVLVDEVNRDKEKTIYGAVVVGSGYGGAVSALRLSKQGRQVLVLERGNEYLTGEFPNDLGEAFGHVRLEREGSRNVNGYESGLYDVRIGDGIGSLVGNGLGGTSLINASVVMDPDPRVFAKRRGGESAWPPELATDGTVIENSLAEGYAQALAMLSPQEFTDSDAFLTEMDDDNGATSRPVKPLKRRRLQELGATICSNAGPGVRVTLVPAQLTVDLGKGDSLPGPMTASCVGCGECVSGCNLNAKRTLTYTYLPEARKAGARMFTGVTVLSVEPDHGHWVVHFVRTDGRKLQRDGVPVPVYELHAHQVVLSAGTFGSTEILLRSRHKHRLPLSQQLGKHMSTNGDSLAFGYMGTERVNGIGIGSSELPGDGYAVGPTITASIRIDASDDVRNSMLIQDGAVPGAIAGLFHELMSTTAALAQLDRWSFLDMPSAGTSSENALDWARLAPRGLSNTQTLLGIGHDPSAGSMSFDEDKGRLCMRYPPEQIAAVTQLHDSYLKQVQQQGGIYLPNPVLTPLPQAVSSVLSGPPIKAGTFTVHPLGGCCMADGPERGVVDHLGRVFDASKAGAVAFHEGLLVLDGSIVPTSLGANPLFTITALAERAMAWGAAPSVPSRAPGKRDADDVEPGSTSDESPTFNPYLKEVNVYFTEAMRAGNASFKWMKEDCNAHLLLHLPIDDLQLFGTDGRHLIAIPDQVGAPLRDREALEAMLSIDRPLPKPKGDRLPKPVELQPKPLARLRVQSGWVSILPVPQVGRLGALSLWLRTLLTWLTMRGWDELWRAVLRLDPPTRRASETRPATKGAGVLGRAISLLKLCGHASESRIMEYHLQLQDVQPRGDSIRTYTLRGIKRVGYPARWRALLRCWAWLKRPLERANVWAAFGELHTRITDEDGNEVGGGVLTLDMLDMTRMHAPQLASQRDTPNALVALAGYPLWFARLLVKTRLWDFRLPDYPTHMPRELTHGELVPVPANDVPTLWPAFPALRVHPPKDGKWTEVPADPAVPLEVRRSEAAAGPVTLKLTRYRHPKVDPKPNGAGLTRFKTLLMLNGFAQSTLSFVPQELLRDARDEHDEPGLAEFFHEQGFDIWLFDYRSSAILDASKLPSTMDDIARYDIPAAVQTILATLAGESGLPADTIQIYAFAHCVGAASMAMSLLGGFLKHPSGADQLAGVTLSQMQAFLVGGKTAQMRLQVGGILRDTLGIDYLRLSGAERQPSTMESMLDRLFASLPVDPGEECPHERQRVWPRPGICTCKRMSGTISRLLKHDMIKEKTHDKLAVYFGRANTSLLVHGGRCVDNERLVNADGQNVYVNDTNIREHLHLPIAILHGAHNALFDVESAYRTSEQLHRVHPHMHAKKLHRLIVADDYAHFDCTIGYGKTMREQILQPLQEFYQQAWGWDQAQGAAERKELREERVPRSFARAPLAGPLIGWTRTVQRKDRLYRLVRLWIEVDDMQADRADWVVTHCCSGPENAPKMPDPAQVWPVIRVPLQNISGDAATATLAAPSPGSNEPYIAIGLADLEFDITDGWDASLQVRMFSLHHASIHRPRRGNGKVAREASRGAGRSIFPPMTSAQKRAADRFGHIPMVHELDLDAATLAALRTFESEGMAVRFDSQADAVTDASQVMPVRALRPAHGAVLWHTLNDDIERQRQAALGADPGTLSRKRRRLALQGPYGPALALLDASIIRGPDPAAGIAFIAGCCRHPGLAFEDTRSDASLACISDHLSQAPLRPSFMLMLGDQIYADATAGVMDRPSAVEKIVLGHRRAFTTGGFLSLTSSLPTYMVIDDHEIGDNWSRDQVVSGDVSSEDLFRTGWQAFTAYQWAHGPRNSRAPGFNAIFEEGECPFFILDTRTQRWRFTRQPQVCDPSQLDELEAWLRNFHSSDPRPKFVVSGSVLAPGLQQANHSVPGQPTPVSEPVSDALSDTWQMAQHQRCQVLSMIAELRVRNVVFLAGDYHCGTIAQLDFDSKLRAYAIVTPPLYAQLPAANVKPRDVVAHENLWLYGSQTVDIVSEPAFPGDGFCQIRVIPQPNGTWRLEVEAHVMDASSKTPSYRVTPRAFTLT